MDEARAANPRPMGSVWLAFWLAGALLVWWLPWGDQDGSASRAVLNAVRIGLLELLPSPTLATVVSLSLLFLGVVGVVLVNRAATLRSDSLTYVRGLVVLLALLSGSVWTLGHVVQARRQDPALVHPVNVSVTGRVVGLPQWRHHALRFVLQIESVDGHGANRMRRLSGGRLLLRRYGYPARSGDWIDGGGRYRMQVRLSPRQSSRNPGGFDYRRWLFRQHIVASGYVRGRIERLPDGWSGWLDRLRSDLRGRVAHEVHDPVGRGLLLGLGLGDRSALPRADWMLLLATGTNHLLAISGLHVGMVAGLFALLVGGVWRRTRYCEGIPAQRVAAIAALMAAWAYALLAGLSIPTERAAIMLTVLLSGILLARRWRSLDLWLLAAVLVLLVDPFAPLDAGFWLSFLAVLVIIVWVVRRPHQPLWRRLIELQLILTLALWPLVWGFFDRIAWASLPANLLAVPLVSWVVTPLALLGLGLSWIAPTSLGVVAQPIAYLGQVLFDYLGWLDAHLPQSHWPAPPLPLMALAVLGVILLLQPSRWPGRWLGVCLLLPVLLYRPARPPEGQVEFWLFDQYRGSVCLVQTRNHALLYGRGAINDTRLDAALVHLGVDHLDTVLVGPATDRQRDAWAGLRSNASHPSALVSKEWLWCWDDVCFDWTDAQHALAVQDGSGRRTRVQAGVNAYGAEGAVIQLRPDRGVIRVPSKPHGWRELDTRRSGALRLTRSVAQDRVHGLAGQEWPFAWRAAEVTADGCSGAVSADPAGMKKPRS